MQSGSLYWLATWGRHTLRGGCTGLVLSFLLFAWAISWAVAADAANVTIFWGFLLFLVCIFVVGM